MCVREVTLASQLVSSLPLLPAMFSSPVQQPAGTCRTSSAGPSPRSTRQRKCRPGYKSRAKLARSRQKAKYFNLVLSVRREKFDLIAEIGNLRSRINLADKSHKEKVTSIENNFTKQSNTIIGKYNQLSEMYCNLQENFFKSEKRNSHLQEQLDLILDENRSLIKKVSVLEQSRPVHPTLNSPLDLRLRALEEQFRPVNSPIDLCLHAQEPKPPEVVYDLVNI